MQINYRQYPHPVLAHFSDDLVKCAFQCMLKTITTKTEYKIEVTCKTSSRDLVNLINDKKAYYAVHIECASTRYRKLFTSFNKEFVFEIAADKLNGRVQVCSFILAAEDIPDYKNKNFNEDYEDATFKVKKGDVLAVDRDRNFIADKEIDPLKKIPSIFTVSVDTSRNAPPMDIDTNSNRVVINLSQENFNRYRLLQSASNLQTTLSSLVVMPALVSLLELIKNAERLDEYDEYRWFRVLASKLKDIGIDLSIEHSFNDSTIAVAQKLIGDPLTSALKNLEGYESDD